ncbi:unnamed protein product [Euphydryas editha]|uniref:Circadian clock-controlled protein n=1 Tax=Euphydryas editha TaxID=104508 RepID=A0AAU9V1J5_EUPED|nr:unnamed protein product [Euphydryas editha]
MNSLLYFAIIGIQFTNSLARQNIPLKCVFRNHNFLNIFETDAVTTSSNEGPTTNSLQFGVVKFDSYKINKEGWILDLKNIEFKGMDEAILDGFSLNFVENILLITFHTDLIVTYDYKTSGYLLLKPIFGEGLLTASLGNTQISMSIPFDFEEINGKKSMKLKEFHIGYDIRNKTGLHFSNLYNGDKKLSDLMHSLINENWTYVLSHFGNDFMDKFAEPIFNVFKNYMLANTLRDFSTC